VVLKERRAGKAVVGIRCFAMLEEKWDIKLRLFFV